MMPKAHTSIEGYAGILSIKTSGEIYLGDPLIISLNLKIIIYKIRI